MSFCCCTFSSFQRHWSLWWPLSHISSLYLCTCVRDREWMGFLLCFWEFFLLFPEKYQKCMCLVSIHPNLKEHFFYFTSWDLSLLFPDEIWHKHSVSDPEHKSLCTHELCTTVLPWRGSKILTQVLYSWSIFSKVCHASSPLCSGTLYNIYILTDPNSFVNPYILSLWFWAQLWERWTITTAYSFIYQLLPIVRGEVFETRGLEVGWRR